jgi:hypothetical protein
MYLIPFKVKMIYILIILCVGGLTLITYFQNKHLIRKKRLLRISGDVIRDYAYKLDKTRDSLDKANEIMRNHLYYMSEPKKLESLLYLALKDREEAHNWTCVAILECGYNLDSKWVINYNNLFGLSYDNKPIEFKNENECIDFLIKWIKDNPNDKSLPFANYLIDKGWASDPYYIQKFNIIKKKYK